MVLIYFGIILILNFPRSCDFACDWPAEFAMSTWQDGFKDELQFTTSTMTGWDVAVGNLVVNEWECFRKDAFETDGFLEMKTTNDFVLFGDTQLYGYLCFRMTKITEVSYRYYLYNPKQLGTKIESAERISAKKTDTAIQSSCSETSAATGSEYHIMIKSGHEHSAGIDCPYVFLGRYGYTLTTDSNSPLCETSNSSWDTCSDSSAMTFDKTKCTANVAYSDSNGVACVDSVPVGTNHLVTVYNPGAIDNIYTFRFSCFAISYDGTQASVTPRNCKESQTPDQIPIATDNTRRGEILTMTEIGDKCPTCPLVPDITGGTVLYLTDGAVTYATYFCDDEYDLYGVHQRACQTDNTWENEAPLCKCKVPAAPANGNVTVSSDGSTATYTCNVGFIMKGSGILICQETNAWDATAPTCDTCAPVSTPVNGKYRLIQNDGITTAAFTCDVGTTLKGFNNSVCQNDGTWDKESPTCVVCDSFSFGTSGNVTMATDGLVSTALFSCMAGYILTGESSVTCDADGNWEMPIPVCECSSPGTPANGGVSSDGSEAIYTCHAGYNIVGTSTRYCQDEGLGWNGTAPSCGQCALLAPVPGGISNVSTDGQTSSVVFTCEAGFTLNGKSSSTCQGNLLWDLEQPSCISCENRESISSGDVSIKTDGWTTTASFTCAVGYYMVGDANQTCDVNGVWSSTVPSCKCILPEAPSNGSVESDSDESTLYFYCDLGFSLSTSFIRTCATDGTGWSGEEPVCNQCPAVLDPVGGTANLETDKTMTSVRYSCSVGYSLKGVGIVECTPAGIWETTDVTCSECAEINSVAGRSHTTATNGVETTATFSCDVGYTLSGTSAISCDQNGEWKETFPNCSKCLDKLAPSSGSVNVTTDGSKTRAYYSCIDGYDLDGLDVLECRAEGLWNGPDPVCKCIVPETPGNGSIMLFDNGYRVEYSCDVGYTLNGSSARTCGDDGSGWSDAPPSCVACDTIPETSIGYFTLIPTGRSTEVHYFCPEGTSIKGDAVLTCRDDGTWGTTSFPSCESCPELSAPASGSINIETDGSTTSATFACLSGYYVLGESKLTCSENGTWDFYRPSCVCQPPRNPDFGTIAVSEEKMAISYTCNIGYTLKGDSNRTCLPDGRGWNGSDPSCVSCPELSHLSGGTFNLNSTGTETYVMYSCDLGSSLKGKAQSNCLPNGTWELDVPTCESCGTLHMPANGNVSYTTDGVVTVATYTCLPGYEVGDSFETICQTTGDWEQTDITCYCVPPEIPPNGNFTLSDDRSAVTFTCGEGFTINGETTRTCGADGSGWTTVNPTCTSCEVLPAVEGGHITSSTNGTYTIANISCDRGYTIKGVAQVTCLSNGTWNINIPECVSCPDINSPSSGNVVLSTNGSISTASFSCADGYDLIGEGHLVCGIDGQWNHDYPVCVCSPPSNISNGNIVVNSTSATYSCDVGYSIDGNAIRFCLEDGSGWSGIDPFCAGCDPLNIPTSGSRNLSSDGSATSAVFNCDVGASINGEVILTCLSSGQWNAAAPNCVMCPSLSEPANSVQTLLSNGTVTTADVTCAIGYDIVGFAGSYCKVDGTWSSEPPTCICKHSDVPAPLNGNRTISGDRQVVIYTCNMGYTLKGNVVRVCQNDSTGWNGKSPTCVSCPELSYPEKGTLTITSDGSSTTAKYTCNVGTSLKGNQSLTCLDTGEWSSAPSACVQCPVVLRPASGNFTIETDGVTSVATYSCVDKYNIVGPTNRSCLQNGYWDKTEPHCACEMPTVPDNGDLMIRNEGIIDYAVYTCNTNYTLKGFSVRNCGSNGEYWDGSDPTCVPCEPLEDVTDGQLSFTSTGTETFASIACQVGTSLSGTNTIKCRPNGTWHTSLPVCNKCNKLPTAANGDFTLETDGVTTTASLNCSTGYEITGTGSISCQSDGSWNIVGDQVCSPVETEDEDNPLQTPLVVVSVLAVVIITILSLLLARFVHLYLKRRRRGDDYGDETYTKYETHDELDMHATQQQNGRVVNADLYDHPPPKDLIGIPLVPFEKTQAPLSHEQHVMERGKSFISPAPWSHQSHVMESNKSPRGVSPAGTEEDTRTLSQASISQISIASLPPLPFVIRPPSSKSPKTNSANGKLNNVKLIHNSSKHLVGKSEKGKQTDDSQSRPMTPVNF